MQAYKFLRADSRSGYGSEPAWAIGETRSLPAEQEVVLCQSGYHSSPSWLAALRYAPGPVAALVEVGKPQARDRDKQASRSLTVLAARDASPELRLFAVACAERALLRERAVGREPDPRSWTAVQVARAYTEGQATLAQLADAYVGAVGAASDAVSVAGGDAANVAAYAAYAAGDATHTVDAANHAADYAAAAAEYVDEYVADGVGRAGERHWQQETLHRLLLLAE